MAPNRGLSSGGKLSAKGNPSSSAKSKPSSSAFRASKSSAKVKRPPPKEVKSKSRSAPEQLKKTKKRQYTEKELDLPSLNMITPVGVQKPRGKKKGKTFVDDQESMMTILAIVNAEKEGQIESKMIKARQMEEIREAKRKEAEVRSQQKKSKLEGIKNELRNEKKTRKSDSSIQNGGENAPARPKGKRKSVAFA